MFEFVTISNGLAIVQHRATGHVYRFRPVAAGTWSKLVLDRVDMCPEAEEIPETHEAAALLFAEQAVVACCGPKREADLVLAPPVQSFRAKLFRLPVTRGLEAR